MRRVLIDLARRKKAAKRGGGELVLSLTQTAEDSSAPDIEELNDALELLEERYPDLAELVSLRYFAGMTMAQAAEALGVPLRTTERNWHFARVWLRDAIPEQT